MQLFDGLTRIPCNYITTSSRKNTAVSTVLKYFRADYLDDPREETLKKLADISDEFILNHKNLFGEITTLLKQIKKSQESKEVVSEK